MKTALLVNLLLLSISGIAITIITLLGNHKWKRFFRERSVMSFEDWYKLFYRDSGYPPGLVKCILGLYARELGVDPTQLRPSDRLEVELSFRTILNKCFCDSFVENVFEELVADTGLEQLRFDPSWRTLDDFLRGIVTQVVGPREMVGETRESRVDPE
jgi:hypothetical protein